MLIRDSQIGAFEKNAWQNFEHEMVEHSKQFAQKHCEILGEPGTRQVVQLAIERARAHGLENYGAARFYVEMVWMLGADFDTDPQFPWVAAILLDPKIPDALAKADRLHEKLMEYLRVVSGPNDEFAIAALKRVQQENIEALASPSGKFEDLLLSRFEAIWPQKAAYTGRAALLELIAKGTQASQSYGVVNYAGIAIFSGLMFAMGHGFGADPQYPWVQSTLSSAPVADPAARLRRLHSKALTYLGEALKYLNQT